MFKNSLVLSVRTECCIKSVLSDVADGLLVYEHSRIRPEVGHGD